MKRSRMRFVPAVIAVAAVLSGCSDAGNEADAPARATTSPGEPVLDGRLLFSRFEESTHTFLSTHVARPDGSDEVEVTMPGPEGGGRWSRAGNEIAVMTEAPDGRITTAVIDAEGKVLREFELPEASLNLVCTIWSPDDSRLACEGWDESDPSATGIYTVRASDGGDVVRLTTALAGMVDFPGDYSPDGSTFVFERTRDEDPGVLMTVPTAGGRPNRLAAGLFADAGRYSPDGATVLTSADGALVLLSSTGDELGRINRDGHSLFGPVWSPDGTRIAYSDATGGPFADIYVARPDGSDRHQVTHTEANEITVSWGAG